jgi:hypothetical protein
MKLDRKKAKLSLGNEIPDDEYVEAAINERIEMVWDITLQLWSVANRGETSAQPRLQRNVANLTKV